MSLPISPEHAQELARLCRHETRPDLVVIGAAALGHHIPLSRVTRDVDLALVVAPQEISGLLGSLGWRRDERITHRWYGAAGFRADVLPATPELVTTGSVQLDRGDKVMSLVGFDLALQHAATVILDGTDAEVKVASLPSLVLLRSSPGTTGHRSEPRIWATSPWRSSTRWARTMTAAGTATTQSERVDSSSTSRARTPWDWSSGGSRASGISSRRAASSMP